MIFHLNQLFLIKHKDQWCNRRETPLTRPSQSGSWSPPLPLFQNTGILSSGDLTADHANPCPKSAFILN